MTLYNVTAEVFETSADAIEERMTAELMGPFSAVLHVSQHSEDGLAITLTLDSWGPGMAANQGVELLSAFGILSTAVEAMPTQEFDRRNGIAAFSS